MQPLAGIVIGVPEAAAPQPLTDEQPDLNMLGLELDEDFEAVSTTGCCLKSGWDSGA